MAVNIIIGLLSVFFLFASSIKILGWQKLIFEKQLEFFHLYGLNRQIMALVGCVEFFGAVAIWFQSGLFGILGAGALALTSVGAIFFHLRFDTYKDAIPAMITLTMSSYVVLYGASLSLQ